MICATASMSSGVKNGRMRLPISRMSAHSLNGRCGSRLAQSVGLAVPQIRAFPDRDAVGTRTAERNLPVRDALATPWEVVAPDHDRMIVARDPSVAVERHAA